MLLKDPEDIYRDYERFLRKKDFARAYQRLETLSRELPEDDKLIERLVGLCLTELQRPDKAKHWLKRLIALRSWWYDYLVLSRVCVGLKDLPQARNNLGKAKELLKNIPFSTKNKKEAMKDCVAVEELIDYVEHYGRSKADSVFQENMIHQPKSVDHFPVGAKPVNRTLNTSTPGKAFAQTKIKNIQSSGSHPKKERVESAVSPPIIQTIPVVPIQLKLSPLVDAALSLFQTTSTLSLQEAQLRLDFEYLSLQEEFNELLCLNSIRGIDKYWYQIETVKKVLKYFHGRVLLCDEVGLGKTVEAGMLIKEYLVRRMAKNVLILVPPALVSQWQEEMTVKFGLSFKTTEDPLLARDPENFWKTPFLIASIHTAKNERNMALISGQFYDIVVVDEAHHLRNRTTQAWHLVNAIQKKFIFLLTATPIQNNLLELFNLITLLKPGQFKTEKIFRKEFLAKGDVRAPANKEKLREVLQEVMIRNTRSAIDLKLPRRFAVTMRLTPTENEQKVYAWLNDYTRRNPFKKPMINLLLKEAGSSFFALRESLLKMIPDNLDHQILDALRADQDIAKGQALIDIMTKNKTAKKIIFTQYYRSMDYITACLSKENIPYVVFRGDMTSSQKDDAIRQFKEQVDVIVSTESGGEGRNLQFCGTIINFDLPWNPMRIEQRIGRLHRIGQTQDIFVFNLSVRGTIEDYIIDILDNKINMFEMVIGEIEPILGSVGQDQDFEDVIMDIWMNSQDPADLARKMESLGDEIFKAKEEYIQTKKLDQNLLGDDYQT